MCFLQAEAKTYDEIVKKLERDVAQLVQENKALQLAADDFRRLVEIIILCLCATLTFDLMSCERPIFVTHHHRCICVHRRCIVMHNRCVLM